MFCSFLFYRQDLLALSKVLGDKPYFMGNEPSSLDCTVFGFLDMILTTPVKSKSIYPGFIKENCKNFVEFHERVKAKYWPDYDKCKCE